MKVAWLSRLPSNPLGKRIARTLAGQGVDTSHVVWSATDRLGLYFVEFGDGPRPTQVTYDRADSAMSRMQPDELPPRSLRQGGRATCISPASPSPSAKAQRQRRAEPWNWPRPAGMTFSFDVNYRAKLWSPTESKVGCHPFAAAANIFFTPIRDAETIYGVSGDPDTALAQLQAQYPRQLSFSHWAQRGPSARSRANRPSISPSSPQAQSGALAVATLLPQAYSTAISLIPPRTGWRQPCVGGLLRLRSNTQSPATCLSSRKKRWRHCSTAAIKRHR
jgi:hypothetical protein